ncbi:MAG: peptidylprolyl isomerase [Spirochaetae bacterium HGW-Spirochaetae-3]|jgi:peptidylprolyl isomerase|nr:MAG: peptidylprolyl isomerase [Spirochaetae bacterium HGW-Spirochaetae-3]
MIKITARASVVALLISVGAAVAAAQTALPADPTAALPDGLYATVVTARGTIVLELFADKAPLAVASFVGLAEGSFAPSGKPFFDGVVFHRVEPGFVIQGGDPTGTGRGGPGYQFPNEIDPSLSFGEAGVLGMANAGPDTNGSQFYITLGPAKFLDGSYTVFGRVASGMQAVQSIRKGDAMSSVRIVRKGAKAAAFKADKAKFDADIKSFASKAGERAKAALEPQYSAVKARIPGLAAGSDGLLYKILEAGDGRRPAPGTQVRILYTLTLSDGKKIDSTADRGNEPFEFKLAGGQVIPGFDAAVAAMSYGERRVVVIPPEMGYGARGAGGVVPGNAVLVFEIELLGL